MSVQVENLEKNMAKLTIEVSAEDLEKALESAYQKQKKQKTWQDGTLVVRGAARRATLADESARVLDSVLLPASFVGTPDEELESDRYREHSTHASSRVPF